MTAAATRRHPKIVVLDFGSQYSQLITRRLREVGVFSELLPFDRYREALADPDLRGLILSGGPSSVYGGEVPGAEPELLELGVPILGICYGMQLVAHMEGGEVIHGRREYGRAELRVTDPDELFDGFEPAEPLTVWCSHGDHVDTPPPGYRTLASTPSLPVAAFRAEDRPIFGVQFHPEVAHTPRGDEILSNFLFRICGCRPTWTAGAFIDETVAEISERVGDAAVICGLSGGVDSSVAATLVHRALGDRLTCIFVDTGLLRKGEREGVERTFRKHGWWWRTRRTSSWTSSRA